MAKKMNRGLVALSSAAILGVYGLGYALSEPAAVSMAAGVDGAATSDVTPSVSAAGTSGAATVNGAVASPSARPAATSTATPTTSSAVKDGTYTGSGTSRHGGVNVSVTIQNGRIVAAPITSVTTRYSSNVIASLPAAVVNAQGPNVNLISGATDSSSAFVQAVQQALSKAGMATASSSTASVSSGTVQVTGPRGVIYSSGRRND